MAFYILPSVFSIMMIVCGLLSWKLPLSWENRESHRWPHYDGKLAKSAPDIWKLSQIVFGKTLLVLGLLHIIMEIPEVMIFQEILKYWNREDATIPAICCLALPGILFILLGNLITTKRLMKMVQGE